MPPGVRSGHTGEQRAGYLRGGRDRGGIKNQRDLHRERTLPRSADRGGSDPEAGVRNDYLVPVARTGQNFVSVHSSRHAASLMGATDYANGEKQTPDAVSGVREEYVALLQTAIAPPHQ